MLKIHLFLLLAASVSFGQIPAKSPTANGRSFPSTPRSVTSPPQFHGFLQGFDLQVWMGNMSTIGLNYSGASVTPDGFGLEYPAGSGIDHLFGAAPWLAAIIDTATGDSAKLLKAVTTGYEGWAGPFFEFHGNPDGSDSFYVTSADVWNGHNKRGYDDDGDGKIDEDELDGVDNDHDGLIDEDYGAVSDQDAYVGYADYYGDPDPIYEHVPLGARVWQKSYSWHKGTPEDAIVFLDYYFINTNTTKAWDSAYVGFFADADVGPKSVGGYYGHNCSGYDPVTHTAYTDNPLDRPSTPIGLSLISTPRPFDSLRMMFSWYPGPEAPANDIMRYALLSSGIIKPNEYPALSDTRFLVGEGPFHVAPQETLHIVYALVSGVTVDALPNSMLANAAHALALYNRGFTHPPSPPSPPLHLTKGFDFVKLDWQWKPGDPGIDPLQAWDDSNAFLSTLPDTDWRRKDPPAGHIHGGRIFEGFRVYRSESPNFDATSFEMLAQYDVNDALGIPYQTGLQYTYTDSGLAPGKTYWYAVTSYSIPYLGNQYSGDVEESSVRDNAASVTLAHEYNLSEAYPDPANPRTTIEYDMPAPAHVQLIIYDVLGQEVDRLVDAEQPLGRYSVKWDASRVASGVYFYRITIGSFVDTKKIVVMR